MAAVTTVACALWFPHHFLSGTEYLGREGVFFQQEHNDCGCAALKMILDRFRIPVEYGALRERLPIGPEGTTMLSIKRLAEARGLGCEGWRLAIQDLPAIPLPAILLLRRKHFVVLETVRSEQCLTILDPVRGRLRISAGKLRSVWNGEALLFCRPPDSEQHRRWFLRRNLPLQAKI